MAVGWDTTLLRHTAPLNIFIQRRQNDPMSQAVLRCLWRPEVFPALLLSLPCLANGGGTWKAHAPMGQERQEHGAARINDAVYVVGGLVPGAPFNATDSVERYDISTGQWMVVAPLPAARDHLAVAACDGMLYAIGGYAGDSAARKQAWVYDPASDAWSSIAPLPSRRGACWGVAHLGRIYVFGGTGPGGIQRSTFIYDPASDTWSQGADMPTAREHLVAAALGDRIFVIGGRFGPATGVNEAYDPAADAWVSVAAMPTPRSAMAVAAWGGRIYVMGGELPILHSVNESYDPSTNAWVTGPPMPLPRHGAPAVTLDLGILIPGGGTVQGFKPTTETDEFVPRPCPGWTMFCACTTGAPCGNSGTEGCANSVGPGARLNATGSVSVTADDLLLIADRLPPHRLGLVFMGADTTRVPLADGLRCVGGKLFRFPVRMSDGGGVLTLGPGIVAHAAGNFPVSIEPGNTWSFQCWYRDAGGACGNGSNLTSALAVTFVP